MKEQNSKTASARGRANRRKGKMGEKEFLGLLQDTIDSCIEIPPHKRPQARRTAKDDGADLVGIEGLAIEIKRQERLQVRQWWRQACIQAETIRDETLRPCRPVLAYRQNNTPWRVIIECEYERAGNWVPLEMDLDSFLGWFKNYVTAIYT